MIDGVQIAEDRIPQEKLAQATEHDAHVHQDRRFMGHPMGLFALFNLEIWERFSYLGFQAILALYFADAIANGGLGYEESTASSIVAAYGALVYLLGIAGAWVADRIVGTGRATLWGAIIIAAGHICMGLPAEVTTWIGLGLIILGTGLLKPNVATQVGELYGKDDARRDSGFAIYYAGINIGAFLGPLVAGWLGQNINWHLGFASAAVGMVLGLILYIAMGRNLGGKRREVLVRAAFKPDANFWIIVTAAVAVVAVGIFFGTRSTDGLDNVVNAVSIITMIVPAAFLLWMYFSKKVTAVERRNLGPYVLLLIALIAYNLTYFQTGNTLNFLALNKTDNTAFGFEYPSTWYISLTAIVEIIMGPVLAWLWVKLGRRQPSVATKVGIGTILGGLAFLTVAMGAAVTPAMGLLASAWLIGCYIFLGLGDLILQTSGMSATTKLAPRAFASQTMAVWFAAMALVQGLQAQIVKLFDFDNFSNAAAYFGIQGGLIVAYGVFLILVSPWMTRRIQAVA
ncbi:peptide MFS transporter [Pseudoglutamicibacter albus]|uniref:peptide MFS transporter n=1 Tax=Pseudoglutamicibacter albus TaxID=98671 RepID=UPI0036124B31